MHNWIAWLLGAVRRRRAPRVQIVVAVSLTVAGVVGITAVMSARLGTNDLRVLGTSIGFAIFSATWATGSAAIRDRGGPARWVGSGTMALSAASLVTLLVAVWAPDEGSARTFGSIALLTLAGSHASIVMRAQRPTDGPTIEFLCAASILLATLDCVAAALIVQGAVEIHDTDTLVKAGGSVVIAMLVTTALPPLLRGQRTRVGHTAAPEPPPLAPAALQAEAASEWNRLLRPAAACGLAAFTALVGFALGAATAKPRTRTYDTPASAPPPTSTPPPVAYVPSPPAVASNANTPPGRPRVLEVGRPTRMARQVSPGPVFKCPALGDAGAEIRSSRPDGTNFDRFELRRGPGGICLRMRGGAVTEFWRAYGSGHSIALIFQRPGTTRSVSEYRVTLAPLETANGAYAIKSQRPGDPVRGPLVQPLRRGAFGMSAVEASILVVKPRPPRWVLDSTTGWNIVTDY